MAHWTQHLEPGQPDGAYLSWKQVQPRVGISRTTAWRLQKAGEFPKPYVISKGRVGYREREVEAWKASRGHRAAEPDPPAPAELPAASRPAPPPVPDRRPSPETPHSKRPHPTATRAAARRRPRTAGASGRQITFDF